MGSIKIILSDKMEKDFREEIFKKYGMKKGNITYAVEEAIDLWIKKNRKTGR
jgi:hypothetical protein